MTHTPDGHEPADAALGWRARHFEAAQRASGVGSWELEVATGRVWMSEVTYRIFDLEPGTIHSLDEFVACLPAHRRGVFRAAIAEAVRAGEPVAYDAPAYQRDGAIRWTRGKGAVTFDGDGKLTHILGTVVDVTELKLAQEEIASKNAALEAANAALVEQAAQLSAQSEDLQRLDRLKDDFLSLLSHELRTPLTTIQGSLDLLERQPDSHENPKIAAYHRRIQSATQTLTALVADLLSAAQLRHGGFILNRAPVEPDALLDDVLDEVMPLAEAKGLSLTRPTSGASPALEGDRLRLAQVLRNLLLNAIRHAPVDGEIAVRVEAPDGELVIHVADSGDGMSEAARARLFEPFATNGTNDGVGLGLFIVKALVEAHGGQVTVSDHEAAEMTFTVRLPR